MPTPVKDNKIYQKYNKKTIQNKAKNKAAFCQEFGLKSDKKIPLLAITFPLTEENNVGLLKEVMPGVLEQGPALAITGIGTKKYQDFFTNIAKKHPQQIVILDDNDESKRKIYSAADIFLCPSKESACLDEAADAMNYGVVPIAPCEEGKLVNYNGIKEQGNAFVYNKKSAWSFFAALVRALENFNFPYDWRAIQVSAMEA